MGDVGHFFNILLVYPITNALVAIYLALYTLHVPGAFGFAIILLTIFIRFVIYPFTHAQLKTSKKMQTLTPHLNHVKEKHKGDAARIQQETMKLYKEHGVNPAAGCLPVLIQLPIIWGLYTVLQHTVSLKSAVVVKYINNIVYSDSLKLSQPWDIHFLGVSLALSPQQLLGTTGPVILLVPILTGVFQFIQSKMMFTTPPKPVLKKGQKPEPKKDDFATAFQSQSLYIFPAMIGFFSFTLPFGLSLYWNTFTIFGILQQYRLSGWGGMAELVNKIKPPKQEVLPAKVAKSKKK